MRHFEAFAKKNNLPLLSLHGGFAQYRENDGTVERLEYRRRWPKFPVDAKHEFDLYFWRYRRQIEAAVREFQPDVLHITGPSDVGQMGAMIAHRLKIPLVASWHTNVQEYAEKRFASVVPFLPAAAKSRVCRQVGRLSLLATARFYQMARVMFAPNQELISELQELTGKPCFLMSRGVDTDLFQPGRRTRKDGLFTIGYVGRLTAEKNIRFLAELEKALLRRGLTNFQLRIVGQGSEEPWLRANLLHAEFDGVLRGEPLAEAYANFDVFAFPSTTDTFGNVVLEAAASGVPAVVTSSGGPKYIVEDRSTGVVARDEPSFIDATEALARNPEARRRMATAALERALKSSWDAVFQQVYAVYETALKGTPKELR
ncbi:MAG: glycosyltransferase, partial [Acidobacteriales bacterium]|nr:glycosyltransferase [Terriglobales bacterium]